MSMGSEKTFIFSVLLQKKFYNHFCKAWGFMLQNQGNMQWCWHKIKKQTPILSSGSSFNSGDDIYKINSRAKSVSGKKDETSCQAKYQHLQSILSAIVFYRHNRFVHRSHREHYWTWRWSPQGNWKPPLIAMWRPRRIVVGCCCRDKCSNEASCVYLQIEQHFNLLKKYIHKHRM